MSIRILKDRCVGCGHCVAVCPGTLIALEKNRAVMKYPKNCWGCVSCVKECPKEAIAFYLGADMGGMGSTLTVKPDGAVLSWKIRKPDGTVSVIPVDRRNSNKY